MSFNPNQFREYVVRPTLQAMSFGKYEFDSRSAENLLMGICATESQFGTYLKQIGGGPALGCMQIEPITHDDQYATYLKRQDKRELFEHFQDVFPGQLSAERLIYDLSYSIGIARIRLWRMPEALPAPNDIDGLAIYWKQYYNTFLGAGEVEDFIRDYNRHVLGKS